MTSSRKVVTAVGYLGLGVVCCAAVLRTWPPSGLLGVVGYLLISLSLVSGRLAVQRRMARAFGSWFFLIAIDTGLSKVWKTHPPSLDAAIIGLMVLGLLWIVYEVWRGRVLTPNDAGHRAPESHQA
jgi:uncharacterized membrane protein YjjB (DUF3815 family)